MIGWQFFKFIPQKEGKSIFEQLLELFKEILLYTSGDVNEALSWLTEIDKKYKITNDTYGMGDFINDLREKGFIGKGSGRDAGYIPTSKMELALRRQALDQIFDQIKKGKQGNHTSRVTGRGDEFTSEIKPFEFGDSLDNIAITESIKSAHINHGIDDFKITQEDLSVNETFYQSQTSTVLMIDISHSMILYGEDRITPAKKVAMALSELIITKYPKDTLDIIVFGNDAWKIEIKDLPYLQVGPYHTNTVAGLELAMEILRKTVLV